jgi:hypothetical protein
MCDIAIGPARRPPLASSDRFAPFAPSRARSEDTLAMIAEDYSCALGDILLLNKFNSLAPVRTGRRRGRGGGGRGRTD